MHRRFEENCLELQEQAFRRNHFPSKRLQCNYMDGVTLKQAATLMCIAYCEAQHRKFVNLISIKILPARGAHLVHHSKVLKKEFV